ncbi:MAG: 30S ribosomal protein S12 methylthiotransferase RimO [Dermatophilus congolensis]|nr:30S ribosomal protein S12 methylthiotransferase RimO [Dermatophilus congolensis]
MSPEPLSDPPEHGTVHVVSLGCSRNDVDSEELAGRLSREGWRLVDSPDEADVAVVNTCGFVASAKKDSIDTILELSDFKTQGSTRAVVAVGCLAERYGRELAEELPEADGVLGFDTYTDMSAHLTRILAGERVESHVPRDRRTLLPIAPASRQQAAGGVALPGHGEGAGSVDPVVGQGGSPFVRARLDGAPWAPLKIASGCDRRCAFCAIPSFRGAFVSRRPSDVLAEARWLAEQGARELFLVSENSTSYGKDLGDIRLLDTLLPELVAVDGIERVRVSYLQPAELRDDLLRVIAATPGVVPYFDLSFQHVAPGVLRQMRRFGDAEAFLALIDKIRSLAPEAGIRSNVIVGFPGETEDDFEALVEFVATAELDVCGVFGYSDEDGTEAADYEGKLPQEVVDERVDILSTTSDDASAIRATARVGETVRVLVEDVRDCEAGDVEFVRGVYVAGRAEHQGPEVDGTTALEASVESLAAAVPAVGEIVVAEVVESVGADLVAVLR